MNFWTTIGTIVMIIPLPVYFLLRARFKKRQQSAGTAADIVTFLLFVAVPLSVEAVWNVPFFSWTAIMAVLIAIILLYVEWKRAKEISISAYLRKTWRVYFLVLFLVYVLIWLIEIIRSIFGYFL